MVVSVSGPASDVGVSILKQGGNAVDAAVATAFALAVTYPAAGNLGGGGFRLIHPAPGAGDPVAIVYRETAPAASFPTMFTKEDTQYMHKSVAVPGTVRGFGLAHQRFGALPWSQLLLPAVALARDGFKIDRNLAEVMNTYLAAVPTHAEFQRVFSKPGGGLWVAGNRLIQPDLARTLQLLAEHHCSRQTTAEFTNPNHCRQGRSRQARHRQPRHPGHSQHHVMSAGKFARLSDVSAIGHRGAAIIARVVPRLDHL